MKFKITKFWLDCLLKKFDCNANDYEEIELEPVYDTAIDVLQNESVKKEWFHKGYHQGFKEGYYEGNKIENRQSCLCSCGGNNFYLRFCDDKCTFKNNGIIAEVRKISSEESKHLFQKKDLIQEQDERKRLCDEIIDEIKTKKIDMFGWKSCLMYSDDKFINNSYNSGLETAISLIESIKNKI